jgi:arylsulfatase A-like enzyme/Flp pilus assembly protein TadD
MNGISVANRYVLVAGLFAVFSAGAVCLWSCSGAAEPRIERILLISIDTCRADYLSCYGHQAETTPNIDAVAREGVLFRNVASPVPLTLPAHCSMLTGTTPLHHGVHDNLGQQLSAQSLTVAETLKEYGFTTGAIVSAFVLDSKFGLDQGFDSYDDQFEEKHMAGDVSERKAGEATRHAIDWLAEHQNERTFLFLHYYDPHAPFEPPEPFAAEFADSPYAGEIAYVDDCIGQVIKHLKDTGTYDSTLIIITGDHGEMLGEHGESTHGYFIYESAIKVPLIIKLPAQHALREVPDLVGLVDIVPTVCALAGIESRRGVQGRSLAHSLEGRKTTNDGRYLYCESHTPGKYNANSLLGVVTDRWKYIQTTRPELYDLANDPTEANDLALKEPNRARELQDQLRQIIEEQYAGAEADSKLALDEADVRRLESLGYVGGGEASEAFDFAQDKDDPKDLIEFHEANEQLMALVVAKDYTEAESLCQKMLTQRPDFLDGRLMIARIAKEQGKAAEAVAHLRRAIELHPESEKAHTKLGIALKAQRKLGEAVQAYRQALRINPGYANAHNHLGLALAMSGQPAEALKHLQEAVRLEPNLAQAHHNLGTALASLGKLDEAIGAYRRAVQIDPEYVEAHTHLGLALATTGRTNEALKHFREAVRLEPNSLGALTAAAWILATHPDETARDPQEAVHLAERAAELTENRRAGILDTLAAAYAAAGQFDEAVTTAQAALSLAAAAGTDRFADDIRQRLELYRQGKPFRTTVLTRAAWRP